MAKLTGKIRYRRYNHGLLLEVEVQDKPKVVDLNGTHAVVYRTKWRDADERDLQALGEINLRDAVGKAYDAGQAAAVEVPPKKEQH